MQVETPPKYKNYMNSHPCCLTVYIISAGKSSVLLDVKPWDDETDMQKLEEAVRSVQMEGLTWGACKLFLLANHNIRLSAN